MTDNRLAVHLDSMKRAVRNALTFTAGMSEAEFLKDLKTQAAVGLCLIHIGEAAVKIMTSSPEFVASHPDWPWAEMRGMRNRAVHDYDNLHPPRVWLTVRNSLPALQTHLEELEPRPTGKPPPHTGS